MQIRESAEMYLETILRLSEKGPVRSIDIAREMGFSRPSVSVTIHNLADEHYVKLADDGVITLENKGREIAERIYERHQVLSALLMRIGVPEEIAVEDACKIEHDISVESFDCIKEAIRKSDNMSDILKKQKCFNKHKTEWTIWRNLYGLFFLMVGESVQRGVSI